MGLNVHRKVWCFYSTKQNNKLYSELLLIEYNNNLVIHLSIAEQHKAKESTSFDVYFQR